MRVLLAIVLLAAQLAVAQHASEHAQWLDDGCAICVSGADQSGTIDTATAREAAVVAAAVERPGPIPTTERDAPTASARAPPANT